MRNRIALINNLTKIKLKYPIQFEDVDITAVEIYMDSLNKESITPILREKYGKFMLIIIEILKGRYSKDLYRKEDGVITAMKFSGGKNNSRIYCKEYSGQFQIKKKVVMAKGLLHKSTQQNDKKINSIIDSIKKYEYEFCKDANEARKLR